MPVKIKSIRKAGNIAGKRILLRADFNVPLKKGGRGAVVADDFKIAAALSTIRLLARYGAKIIIATHLGNPLVKDDFFSTAPIAVRLGKLLGRKVKFVGGPIGFEVGAAINKMKNKDIILLENLRFDKGEKQNSRKFAKELASLADIYVNDSFATDHREHASLSAIKKYLPAYAGLLLEKEIISLNKVIKPAEPLVLIMGGSKMAAKMTIIKKFYAKSFRILIAGALANDFAAAAGKEIGYSLSDKAGVKQARKYKDKRKIMIPVDFIVRSEITGRIFMRGVNEVKKTDTIFDVGPKTVNLYSTFIRQARTIIWNGPAGMFEDEKFRYGTMSIAEQVAKASRHKAFVVAGGGETLEALKMAKAIRHIDWPSTGGGAMLAYLGGEKMPGLAGIVG